mgnify:CR=1 FL=1
MFRIKVLLASTLTIILVLTIQYSGAQGIVSISKEDILTPNEEPQVEAQEPAQKESLGVDVNEDTFTCMSDSVDKPTKANCTITNGGVSTSYDCNADATTRIWSCVQETPNTSTDKSTLPSTMMAAKRDVLKQIIQNMRG